MDNFVIWKLGLDCLDDKLRLLDWINWIGLDHLDWIGSLGLERGKRGGEIKGQGKVLLGYRKRDFLYSCSAYYLMCLNFIFPGGSRNAKHSTQSTKG